MPIEPAEDRGLPRRDFLKVGLGFSLALTVGTAVVGCSDAAKTLSTGYVFLRPGDVELFSALTPAVVTELGAFDAAKRSKLVERTLQNIDGTCAALDLGINFFDTADVYGGGRSERLMARLKMAELPRNANPTRVRNRCSTTGRPRGYYRKFGLCRVELRDLGNKGLIPGLTKSSW